MYRAGDTAVSMRPLRPPCTVITAVVAFLPSTYKTMLLTPASLQPHWKIVVGPLPLTLQIVTVNYDVKIIVILINIHVMSNIVLLLLYLDDLFLLSLRP